MKNEKFFNKLRAAMRVEFDRLDRFTEELDRDPAKKHEMIVEYKCAKCRGAGIGNISTKIYFCNKFGHKYEEDYYQLPDVWELVKNDATFFETVDSIPDDEKRTVALYLGILAYTDHLIAEKEALLSTATDWEKIELTEYIGGYKFARACIIDAWEAA